MNKINDLTVWSLPWTRLEIPPHALAPLTWWHRSVSEHSYVTSWANVGIFLSLLTRSNKTGEYHFWARRIASTWWQSCDFVFRIKFNLSEILRANKYRLFIVGVITYKAIWQIGNNEHNGRKWSCRLSIAQLDFDQAKDRMTQNTKKIIGIQSQNQISYHFVLQIPCIKETFYCKKVVSCLFWNLTNSWTGQAACLIQKPLSYVIHTVIHISNIRWNTIDGSLLDCR